MTRSVMVVWPMATAILLLSLFFGALHLWPASSWYVAHSVHVDSGKGKFTSLPMQVDRVIVDEFVGDWIVTVRAWEGGWTKVCAATGSGTYRPDAKLPKNLTLKWWLEGQCADLPPARYHLITALTIRGHGLFPDKHVTFDSNVFDLLE